MLESQAIVRINGVLPDISILGDAEKSERAAEVKRTGMTANTSCSILLRDKKNTTTTTTTTSSSTTNNNKVFHLLVDVGEGVVKSLEKIDLSPYPGFNSLSSGWDFLSLSDDVHENLFWNPDLVILGTQSYNPHPETGLISISDAFELV
jgi:hypothetical protein